MYIRLPAIAGRSIPWLCFPYFSIRILHLPQRPSALTFLTKTFSALLPTWLKPCDAAPGVVLAANQVGILKRIIVIDVTDDKTGLRVLCNPEIIEASEELQDHEEGCLSLKGLYEHVKRPAHVRVRAQDATGKEIELDCTGLLAVCVQHEMDHLDGIVFIDHLSMLKKQRACTKLRKLRREEREKEKEKAARR